MKKAYCTENGDTVYFVKQVHADWWVCSKRVHRKAQMHSKFPSETEAIKRLAEMATARILVEVKL